MIIVAVKFTCFSGLLGTTYCQIVIQSILTPLHNAERTSTQCAPTISTILGGNSFVYILTTKLVSRIGTYECAARCAMGQ